MLETITSWFITKKPKKETPILKKKILIITDLIMINNRTEREYTIVSENEFGLDWATVGGWLHIKQLTDFKGDWKTLAAVTDFYIIKCSWITIEI